MTTGRMYEGPVLSTSARERGLRNSHVVQRELRAKRAEPPAIDWEPIIARFLVYMRERDSE